MMPYFESTNGICTYSLGLGFVFDAQWSKRVGVILRLANWTFELGITWRPR